LNFGKSGVLYVALESQTQCRAVVNITSVRQLIRRGTDSSSVVSCRYAASASNRHCVLYH